MAKEVSDPRIMLLSSGIEYTRTENKFASLDTILEQESKYMEIVVTRITKLKPDVLMVGRSVNRKAQELLLSKTNIVLLQHVKVGLMERIARQTGATILSSMHQIMNQFGSAVLGECELKADKQEKYLRCVVCITMRLSSNYFFCDCPYPKLNWNC